MKQSALLLALFCFLITLISCNQSDDDVQIDQPVPRIKKITTVNGRDTSYVRFEYDDSWRLLRRISSYGYLTIYTYGADTIHVQIYLNDGTPYGNPDIIRLNNQGLAFSSFRGAQTYQYNPEGYLTEMVAHSNQNLVYTYTILNGNTTRVTEIFDNDLNTLEITEEYEFLPHSVNTIGEENIGRAFYGKQNKELISSQYNPSRGAATTQTFRYELDAKKRVTKRIQENGPTDIYTYYEL